VRLNQAIFVLCACAAAVSAQPGPVVHSAEMSWGNPGADGPGTSTKVLLTKANGFLDDLIRAMWLVKVDPGGQYTVTSAPKEDLAFFVAKGTGRFTLGDEQIETKPGDAYGVPAGVKHGLANTGAEPVELVVFAAPLLAPNPTAKPLKGRADDMKWEPNATHGPGCDLKMLFGGGFSTVIRGLWIMRGNPGSINIVHSGAEHQLFYMWVAPEPSKTPRDSRTEGARLILRDRAMQTRAGDAIYAAGAPRIDEHGFINESPKDPLIYVAIGVRIPGQGGGQRGGGRRGGAPPAGGPPQPGR
jgi:mannose-6-phosphate isomerase-like protein (cupin superfamily)